MSGYSGKTSKKINESPYLFSKIGRLCFFFKTPFLAFEIESNLMICSLKPLYVQQFVKKLHLRVQNSG